MYFSLFVFCTCCLIVQSKVGVMIWKPSVTCSCIFCGAVCHGKASRPTRSKNDIRRSVIRRGWLLLKSCVQAKQVCYLTVWNAKWTGILTFAFVLLGVWFSPTHICWFMMPKNNSSKTRSITADLALLLQHLLQEYVTYTEFHVDIAALLFFIWSLALVLY